MATMIAPEVSTSTASGRLPLRARVGTEAPKHGVILLAGEPFDVTQEGASFVIEHPQWSLMGSGNSIRAAVRDLFSELADVREALTDDDAVLSPEAERLLRFAEQFGG